MRKLKYIRLNSREEVLDFCNKLKQKNIQSIEDSSYGWIIFYWSNIK